MTFTSGMRICGLPAFYAAAMAMVLTLGLGGCTPSYINVPPIDGDAALNNPDLRSVIKVEAAALKHVLERQPPDGQYAIKLPPETGPETYRRVLAQLPSGGNRGSAGGEIPEYRVEQVQVRGYTAQVDVVRPNEYGEKELVSIFLGTDIEGWYVTRTRVWQIPVEDALEIIEPLPAEGE